MSWRRCHISSGFSPSQFVLFLHVLLDRLDDDQFTSLCGALAVVRQKSHWIITINGKINVCKCKLIFPTESLQQKIEITDLEPFLFSCDGKNTSVIIIWATVQFLDFFFCDSVQTIHPHIWAKFTMIVNLHPPE